MTTLREELQLEAARRRPTFRKGQRVVVTPLYLRLGVHAQGPYEVREVFPNESDRVLRAAGHSHMYLLSCGTVMSGANLLDAGDLDVEIESDASLRSRLLDVLPRGAWYSAEDLSDSSGAQLDFFADSYGITRRGISRLWGTFSKNYGG